MKKNNNLKDIVYNYPCDVFTALKCEIENRNIILNGFD